MNRIEVDPNTGEEKIIYVCRTCGEESYTPFVVYDAYGIPISGFCSEECAEEGGYRMDQYFDPSYAGEHLYDEDY